MQKLTKADLVTEVAVAADMTKAEAERTVNSTFEVIAEKMAQDIAVPIPKFGTFCATVRGERSGRNPLT